MYGMKQYEHRIETTRGWPYEKNNIHNYNLWLNRLGEEGWELVTVLYVEEERGPVKHFYLKREKPVFGLTDPVDAP